MRSVVLHRAAGPIHQFAAAIGAVLIQLIRAIAAERAFERTDKRAGCLRRKIAAAAFAIGAHFKHLTTDPQ